MHRHGIIAIRPAMGGYILEVATVGDVAGIREHVFSSWDQVMEFLQKNPCPSQEMFEAAVKRSMSRGGLLVGEEIEGSPFPPPRRVI